MILLDCVPHNSGAFFGKHLHRVHFLCSAHFAGQNISFLIGLAGTTGTHYCTKFALQKKIFPSPSVIKIHESYRKQKKNFLQRKWSSFILIIALSGIGYERMHICEFVCFVVILDFKVVHKVI